VRRVALAGVVGAVVVLLVVAQLVLPGIAARRLHDQLARSGQVLSVQVHAFPAIELLWHHADRVVIRLGSYRPPVVTLGSSLSRSGDVGSLDATATKVNVGLLALHHAHLGKRGNYLTASATVSEADLHAALPILRSVTPVASTGGQLTLQGTASLLGIAATVQAVVGAVGGRLVATPNVPLGGFAASPCCPVLTWPSRAWAGRPSPGVSPFTGPRSSAEPGGVHAHRRRRFTEPGASAFTGRRWFTEAHDHLHDRPRRRLGSRRSAAADARLLRLLFRLAVR
jgi:LmeA-like phospholipid-binding